MKKILQLIKENHKKLDQETLLITVKSYRLAIARMFDTDIMIYVETILDKKLDTKERDQKMSDKINSFFSKANKKGSENLRFFLHGLRIIRNTSAHPDKRVKYEKDQNLIKELVDKKIILNIILLEDYKIEFFDDYYLEVIKLLKTILKKL